MIPKNLNNLNTIVTGGMGYVGSFTCNKYLKKYGKKLFSIDNNSRSNKSAKKYCKNFNLDIAKVNKLKKIFKDNNIKQILHLASFTCVRESIKKPNVYKYNNLIKQKEFIKAAKKSGIKKFIFSSSMSIYEKNQIKSNLSPYSKYKLAIENYLKKQSDENFKVIILRYPNISGAQDNGLLGDRNHKITRIFKTIFKKILKNNVLIIYTDLKKKMFPIRNYAHVEDIAEINLKILNDKNKYTKNSFQLFNILTKLNISNYDILLSMEKLMKKKAQIIFKQADKRENFFPFTKRMRNVKKFIIKSNKSTHDKILTSNFKWFKKIEKEL